MEQQQNEQQTELNKQMALLLKSKIESFNPWRRSKLLEIKVNIAYLCNHQNIEVINNTIVPIKDTDYRHTQVVANKIFPAVLNDVAVSTKGEPRWDVVPDGTDEDDKATAKAGDKILSYLLRINNFNQQRKSIVLWYDIAGIGWRKIYWDPFYKVIGRNPFPGEEGHNSEMKGGEPIFQGEVVSKHIPNNQLIFDWRNKNTENMKWFIHADSITRGEAIQRYGKDFVNRLPAKSFRDKLDKKDSFEVDVIGEFDKLSQQIAGIKPKPQESSLIENDKLINYYEFWHVIDKNMSQGAYAEALGDPDNLAIAVNEPYPMERYPHGELPLISYNPMSLDGISIDAPPRISLARPLQRHYNRVSSQIADNLDAMGNSVFMASKQANLDFKKIENSPANVIEYEGMYKPSREAGVTVPGALFAYRAEIRKDIDEIFAFHEPSKGIMPEGGPKSAIGLQVLQEADVTQLSPMINSMDLSDRRAAYQMLSLALANYNERLIHIVGKDNEWTLYKINPSELNGKVNVIIHTGSSLPLNKTIESQKTFEAWSSGLLGNPMDPTVRLHVLKTMDLGGVDQILQNNSKHINFAQKEFINAEKLAMQMPPVPPDSVEIDSDGKMSFTDDTVKQLVSQFVFVPPVNEFDDHYTHLQEHTNYLLDKYYEFIGSGQPHLQLLAQVMRDHIQQHQFVIAQQQIAMAQLNNPKDFREEKKETK